MLIVGILSSGFMPAARQEWNMISRILLFNSSFYLSRTLGMTSFPLVEDWFQSPYNGKWLLVIDNADGEEVFSTPLNPPTYFIAFLNPDGFLNSYHGNQAM
jgi:hypothetical protein